MDKCGYTDSNPALFARKLYKPENSEKVTCLESKYAEVQANRTQDINRRDRHKTLRTQLNNYDCSTLNGYIKLICRKNKRSGN